MTTPSQLEQEATVKELVRCVNDEEITLEQALRKSYLLGRQYENSAILAEVGSLETNLKE